MRIILLILMLSLPLLLTTSAIRLALTPVFISVEYRLPGFPADEYGFSLTDRLTWARYSIDYLLGQITHEELTSQVLPDGTPLFNERELSHMLDVRTLTTIVIKLWLGLLAFFMMTVIFSWLLKEKKAWWRAIQCGSSLTLALIFGILFYLALNFNQLFTQFHQLFFKGDSWLFLMSDNLIRLFPMRFWRDIFIFIGTLSIVLAGLLILMAKASIKNNRQSGQNK